jgi:hypothetical protein
MLGSFSDGVARQFDENYPGATEGSRLRLPGTIHDKTTCRSLGSIPRFVLDRSRASQATPLRTLNVSNPFDGINHFRRTVRN